MQRIGTVATMMVAYLTVAATDSTSPTLVPPVMLEVLFCSKISRRTSCRGYISRSRRIADAQNQPFHTPTP